jgi:cytochrome P450
MPPISPPGPKGHWLMGMLPEFRRDNLAFYSRCARDYGDVVAYRLGPHRIIQLNHPDLIEFALVTGKANFNKSFFALRLLHPVLGNGLITSDGGLWLRQRRLAQPAFHRDHLPGYAGVMVAGAQRFRAQWQDGQVRDLHADMMRLTLDVAAKILFNADLDGAAAEVALAFQEVQHLFHQRFESLLPLPVWVPTPANWRLRSAVRRLDTIIYEIVRERRACGRDRDDLLSRFLPATKPPHWRCPGHGTCWPATRRLKPN